MGTRNINQWKIGERQLGHRARKVREEEGGGKKREEQLAGIIAIYKEIFKALICFSHRIFIFFFGLYYRSLKGFLKSLQQQHIE